MSRRALLSQPADARRGRALVALGALFLAVVACDRPVEPVSTPRDDAGSAAGSETPSAEGSGASGSGEDREPTACVTPLTEPPPPPSASLAVCPPDPDGRPTMPRGRVRFDEATVKEPDGSAPAIEVELALNDTHRAHGLMYRPTLSDEEGMLFSWAEEAPRSFWMRNTCLALDMMFLDEEGTIVGVLEQVPPWNELSRRSPCPAAHVLEVRAGFTRDHGVAPGQHVTINPN